MFQKVIASSYRRCRSLGKSSIPHRKSLVEILEARRLLTAIVVNTLADLPAVSGGFTSLRAAIAQADSASTAATITFDPTLFASAQTITLSQGVLDLSGTGGLITISGPTAGVTLSGGTTSGVFRIDSGVNASLSNLTLTDGTGYQPVGGPETDGGGIFNAGTLGLSNVTITANSAGEGGGIYNKGGTITLSGSSVSNNTTYGDSGGIDNVGGTMTLTNDTISGNVGYALGGGISNENGNLTLTDVTVSGNTSGTGSVGGQGGGIYASGGSVTLTNVTVANNIATHGPTADFMQVPGFGGGIFNSLGTLTLNDSTISANSASDDGGIYNLATLDLSNSIVAANIASVVNPDLLNSGTLSSFGHNLIGNADASGPWLSSDLTGTTTSPLNPELGALAGNGGPTQTLLPLPGSPVIDAGSNPLIPAGITTDQRGLPRISGPAVDIGSVEVQQPAGGIVPFTGTPIGTAGSWSAGTGIAAAFDGNLNTYFDPPASAVNPWVGLDLGTPQSVTQIQFAPRAGYADRMVGGEFQVSSTPDFSADVHTVYAITQAPPTGVLTTVNFTAAGAYRYVRYTGGTQWTNIAEMHVAGVVVPVKLTGTPIGTAGSWSPGTGIAAAFDGNLSTYFDPPASGNLSDWVGLDLGSPQTITQIKFAPRAGYAYRMVGAEIQVSSTPDFSSNVQTIYTTTTAPATGVETTITIAPVTARYIRYVGGTQWVNIAELEVDGV